MWIFLQDLYFIFISLTQSSQIQLLTPLQFINCWSCIFLLIIWSTRWLKSNWWFLWSTNLRWDRWSYFPCLNCVFRLCSHIRENIYLDWIWLTSSVRFSFKWILLFYNIIIVLNGTIDVPNSLSVVIDRYKRWGTLNPILSWRLIDKRNLMLLKPGLILLISMWVHISVISRLRSCNRWRYRNII